MRTAWGPFPVSASLVSGKNGGQPVSMESVTTGLKGGQPVLSVPVWVQASMESVISGLNGGHGVVTFS